MADNPKALGDETKLSFLLAAMLFRSQILPRARLQLVNSQEVKDFRSEGNIAH